jgi:hypothetical protein
MSKSPTRNWAFAETTNTQAHIKHPEIHLVRGFMELKLPGSARLSR